MDKLAGIKGKPCENCRHMILMFGWPDCGHPDLPNPFEHPRKAKAWFKKNYPNCKEEEK